MYCASLLKGAQTKISHGIYTSWKIQSNLTCVTSYLSWGCKVELRPPCTPCVWAGLPPIQKDNTSNLYRSCNQRNLQHFPMLVYRCTSHSIRYSPISSNEVPEAHGYTNSCRISSFWVKQRYHESI